jgi:hypothetical protein
MAAAIGTTTAPEQMKTVQVNNNDNIIPLTKTAANPATNGSQQQVTDPNQGNTAVLLQAQNSALNQQPNAITPLITQKTSQLLQDPNLGYDYTKQNANTLRDYDREQAQAMEAARQKLGSTSQSGELQNNFLQNQMQVSAGRSDLQSKNDQAAAAASQTNYINALAAGRATQAGNDASSTAQIGNLATVRGMGEGERSQTTAISADQARLDQIYGQDVQKMAIANGYNMDTLDKTYGQDMAKLVANQDWQGGQAQLDREAAVVAQGTDINAKNAIQDKQNAFDMAKLNATQDWQGAQNKITQDFQTALQTNSQDAAMAQLQKQLDLDKWKQENGQTFTAGQNAINNALQLTLKDKDTEAASNLMTLKGQIDAGALINEQSFSAVQADLDRKEKEALQKGDIAGQLEIQKQRGEIDAAAQTAQQEWSTAERTATQSWTTDENIDKVAADKAAQYFDAKTKKALQAGDIQGQKDLEKQKFNFDTQLKTQDMNQQTRLAYINAQIAEAKAKDDTDRQKQLIQFSATQEITKMAAEQGYEQANMNLKSKLDIALQNNDAANVEALTVTKLVFDATEAAKDRSIAQQKVEFEGRQIESEIGAKTFEEIEAAVAAGQIAPEAAVAAIQTAADKYGIKIEKADSTATQKKIDADFADQIHQYGLSHPGSVVKDAKGNEKLTDQGVTDFNAYINGTIYHTDGTGQDAISKLQSGEVDPVTLRGNKDTEKFKAVQELAKPWNLIDRDTGVTGTNTKSIGDKSFLGTGASGTNKGFVNPVPADKTMVTIDGTLYQVTGGVTTYQGDESILVTNVNDGTTKRVVAGRGLV